MITNNGYNQQMFSEQWTSTLSELYPTYTDFKKDYDEIGLDILTFKDPAFLNKIYLLLMCEYGASAIQSLSPDLQTFSAQFDLPFRFFSGYIQNGCKLA